MRLGVLVLTFLLLAAFVQAEPAPPLRLHFIDVGQGDATLIEASCGAALVDAGGEGNDPVHHGDFVANDQLRAYLDAFFARRTDLKRLDLLLLTHPHPDHITGVPMVLERYKPRNIVDNGQPGTPGSGAGATRDEVDGYAAWADRPPEDVGPVGFQRVKVRDLPRGGSLSGAVIDPLNCSPVDPVFEVYWGEFGSTAHGFDNANNHSVVLKVGYGEGVALFTGDLQEEGLAELFARIDRNALDADVLQVGHHGSHNATTRRLLDNVSPRVAVISMGPHDRHGAFTAYAHGHPRRDVIDLLDRAVSEPREPVEVFVATGQRTFVRTRISQAIYATGWDGHVVVELGTDGAVAMGRPEVSRP